jgi:hypothetical protein
MNSEIGKFRLKNAFFLLKVKISNIKKTTFVANFEIRNQIKK